MGAASRVGRVRWENDMDKSSRPILMVPLLALLTLAYPVAMALRSPGSSSNRNPQAVQAAAHGTTAKEEPRRRPAPA